MRATGCRPGEGSDRMANASTPAHEPVTMAAVGRWAVAVVLSALAGGVTFLTVVGWAEGRGATDLDFNHSLGVLIGGEGTQARTDAALGVSGDTAAPTGLAWFALFAVVVMAVYGLTVHRLRRPWYVQAIPLALGVFVLVMLVALPLIDAGVDEVAVGAFGLDAGGATPLVFAAASLAFAILAARVFSLAVTAEWWRIKEVRTEDALAEIEGMETLSVEPVAPDRPRGGGAVPPGGI